MVADHTFGIKMFLVYLMSKVLGGLTCGLVVRSTIVRSDRSSLHYHTSICQHWSLVCAHFYMYCHVFSTAFFVWSCCSDLEWVLWHYDTVLSENAQLQRANMLERTHVPPFWQRPDWRRPCGRSLSTVLWASSAPPFIELHLPAPTDSPYLPSKIACPLAALIYCFDILWRDILKSYWVDTD